MESQGVLCKIQVAFTVPVLSIGWKLHPNLARIIENEFIPNSIYFTNGTQIINSKSEYSWYIGDDGLIQKISILERIPFICNTAVIWKSIDSFHQNNMEIAPLIYKTVDKQLHASITDFGSNPNTIIAIGGDLSTYLINYWYKFASYSSYPQNLVGISNSESIIQDAKYNFEKVGFISAKLQLVNYAKFKDNVPSLDDGNCAVLIIHLAKLHIAIIEWIMKHTNGKIKSIVIIYCHHDDFQKKTMLLADRFIIKEQIQFPNGDSEPIGICRFIVKS
jgi:hypothetical protein